MKMTDEHQDVIDKQIENERNARVEAANAIEGVFKWAVAVVRAFPENVGAAAWQSGSNLILRYDEHDAILVLGVRAADGSQNMLHVVRGRAAANDEAATDAVT
jgi:hypothetical protein